MTLAYDVQHTPFIGSKVRKNEKKYFLDTVLANIPLIGWDKSVSWDSQLVSGLEVKFHARNKLNMKVFDHVFTNMIYSRWYE